jgi:ABC-type thiamine transport system substrate-binding protein
MPNNKPNPHHHDTAENIVRELLTRYLTVITHDTAGGDPETGLNLEQQFQSQQTHVIDLVAAGLATGNFPF